MNRHLSAALIVLTLASCGIQTKPSANEIWSRQLECSERADRFAESIRSDTNNDTTRMGLWRSHYNSALGRCYIVVDQYTTASIHRPYLSHTLYDALERRPIAQFAPESVWDNPPGVWCQQTSEDAKREISSAKCKDVADYVSRLMKE